MGKIFLVNKIKNTFRFENRNIKINPQRTARYQWLRLVRLKGDPTVIARGIAIGTFVGFTPTIPFHTVLTISFCIILRGHLVAGLITSVLVSNPLTIPFQYYLSWKVGTIITGSSISWGYVKNLMNLTHNINILEAIELIYINSISSTASLLLGGIILSLPLAIIIYFLSLHLYINRKKKTNKTPAKNDHNDSKSIEENCYK
jgi:uncharacterized protein (DUF2062 family)